MPIPRASKWKPLWRVFALLKVALRLRNARFPVVHLICLSSCFIHWRQLTHLSSASRLSAFTVGVYIYISVPACSQLELSSPARTNCSSDWAAAIYLPVKARHCGKTMSVLTNAALGKVLALPTAAIWCFFVVDGCAFCKQVNILISIASHLCFPAWNDLWCSRQKCTTHVGVPRRQLVIHYSFFQEYFEIPGKHFTFMSVG